MRREFLRHTINGEELTRILRGTLATSLRPSMSSTGAARPTQARPSRERRGFTLVELLVVLMIVVILTSLLMPGLRSVRESANRLRCGANLRQIGYALTVYGNDHNDYLPYSYFGSMAVKQPGEMMAVTTGGAKGAFEGVGRLLPRCGGYLDSAACLYCPSHHGDHSLERYEVSLRNPKDTERAYANYHYRGDADFVSGRRFVMINDHASLLLTDGLRTKSDFNHRDGLNLLHGDLAVAWLSDHDGMIRDQIPDAPPSESVSLPLFGQLWDQISKKAQEQ